MKKHLLYFAALTLCITISVPNLVFASAGRTDANGCHTEKATGNYHCHEKPPIKEARTSARVSAPSVAKTVAKDYNCSDFTTHKEAQDIFESNGGVANDVYQLDADKDGIACEELQ
jgi:hypothetical protein